MGYAILGAIIVLLIIVLIIVLIIYKKNIIRERRKTEIIKVIPNNNEAYEIIKPQEEKKVYKEYRINYEIEGKKIFEIKPFDKKDTLNLIPKNKIDNYSSLSSLNGIVSQIPMLAVNIKNFKQAVLTFPPDVIKGLKDGSLKLMGAEGGVIKAVAVDATSNKIVKIGEIASKVNPVSAIAVGWQILATITAQKFLSEINKKLERIESSINEIKEFLEIQQISRVTGNLKKLKNISSFIQSSMLSDDELRNYHLIMEDIDCPATSKLDRFWHPIRW